ncbi:hypothetical protein DFH06DRAFT_1323658 [Mycena polygramma]|nr:hypothetical protein DFH06DRAFT_1323658 [Mycena polygramma]
MSNLGPGSSPRSINCEYRHYTPARDYSGRIRRFTSPPHLDFCVYRRVVRVGTQSSEAGLEFWRSTCFEFTPRPPLTSGARFDVSRMVNRYIIPPLDYNTAVQAVAWGLVGQQSPLPVVTVGMCLTGESFVKNDFCHEESVIDPDMNPDALFCAVFRKPSGIYEVALVLSAGGGLITKSCLIFAPSAWRHAAQVLANCGRVTENTHRLFCHLYDGEQFTLDVDSSYVDIEDGWQRL